MDCATSDVALPPATRHLPRQAKLQATSREETNESEALATKDVVAVEAEREAAGGQSEPNAANLAATLVSHLAPLVRKVRVLPAPTTTSDARGSQRRPNRLP